MFDKKRPNSAAVGRIKDLIKHNLNLPETIITAHAEDNSRRDWRINKPISEISEKDISAING